MCIPCHGCRSAPECEVKWLKAIKLEMKEYMIRKVQCEEDERRCNVPDPDASLLEAGKNVFKYAEIHLNLALVIEAAQKVDSDIKIPQLQ
ncbi:hypothetical protein Tco_1554420 [Tanacetum coccineum]